MPRHARLALDRNANLAHPGKRDELGNAKFHGLRAEFVEYKGCERLGESLEQRVIVTCAERANSRDDSRIVDRVGELARLDRPR